MFLFSVIEQKQKKIRERKKKPKKRPVSPLGSTPTEPIPETPVIVQEQVVSSVQRPPQVVQDRVLRTQAPAAPTQAVIDPTEEFFKEAQSQYQPGPYRAPEQYTAEKQDAGRSIKENGRGIVGSPEGQTQDNKVADCKENGGDLVDGKGGSPGDVKRKGGSQKGDSQQAGTTNAKKKGKKGEKAKGDKSKGGGDKKRKKSRAKSAEKVPDSPVGGVPEKNADEVFSSDKPVNGVTVDRPSSASPSNFKAIDATPYAQRSPGKSLSTTDIRHQHHSVGGLQDTAGSRHNEVLRPRMTKSLSHHGNLTSEGTKLHNLSLDSYALGLRTARQMYGLSKEEIEYITRSQIFDMIKGKL